VRPPSGNSQAPGDDGERFRELLASDRIGIVIADRQGSIHHASPAFLQMLDFDRSALPLDWSGLIPPGWRHLVRTAVKTAPRGAPAAPWQMELLSKRGHLVPVLVVDARRVSVERGEYVGVVLDRRHPRGLQALVEPRAARQLTTGSRRLTVREDEVLRLIAEGYATSAIAARLGVSMKTIASHREHLMEKLAIHSIAGLTRYAIRAGIVSPDA
jgi:DNA-binding CsgD family transcriptional regulator